MHVGIAYLRWRGKRSRHSRRMHTRDYAYLSRGPLYSYILCGWVDRVILEWICILLKHFLRWWQQHLYLYSQILHETLEMWAAWHRKKSVGGLSQMTDNMRTLRWYASETHREAFTIMMVADVLELNRHQATSNHHVVSSATRNNDSSYESYYVTYISRYSH